MGLTFGGSRLEGCLAVCTILELLSIWSLTKLVTMQKEIQKQMSTLVAVPMNKEGMRVETTLGRSMEKAVKANVDALWAPFQEENAIHEKMERDRLQQITGSISNCINKDLPSLLEKTLKKELLWLDQSVK